MTPVNSTSNTPVTTPDQTLHWMGLRLRVPGDWHLRRHGISPEAGTLVFVDRRVQRLELVWSRPAGEPDIVRMVAHAVEILENAQPECHITPHLPRDLPAWKGFCYDAPPFTARALHYHPEHNVLLQVTLSLDGLHAEARRQVREILSAIQVAENPDAATHWRAFGLDARLPPACVLREAKVRPMDVTLTFDHVLKHQRRRRVQGSVALRRLGMAADWFDGDLEAYARRRTSGLQPDIHRTPGPPSLCIADARIPKQGLAGKLGRTGSQQLRLWHDPATNSLFELTLTQFPEPRELLKDIQVTGVAEWLTVPSSAPASPPAADGGDADSMALGIPVRNAAVTEEPASVGTVLKVPLRPRWWTRGLFRWIFPFRDSRAFGMDAFGAEVWSDCDGERTVESICERFACRHAVSYDEAKAAVYHFLRTLTQRELILIQMPQTRLDRS